MIILYGSYAKGGYVEYDERVEFGIPTTYMSDYDILVVTEGISDKDAGQILDRIDAKYYTDPDFRTPVQFINDDIEKLNSDLSEGRYFYTEVKKDGILLYDSGKHKLVKAAYVEARYNPKFAVTKEDIDTLMPLINQLFELVKSICEEKIREYEQMSKEK